MTTQSKLKVLNLYAGIGGNRKLWGEDIEVTAVELNPEIAKIYQHFFPNDKVIIADAHQFLLEHFEEFDFIWSSPPCPTHSRVRFMASKRGDYEKVYPDMMLYQEIIFLDNFFKGKFVIENVRGYYEPLIKPQEIGRHFFWANFIIPNMSLPKSDKHDGTIEEMQEYKGFDLSQAKLSHRKDQILRNCVLPKLGLHIFNSAFKKQDLTKFIGEVI